MFDSNYVDEEVVCLHPIALVHWRVPGPKAAGYQLLQQHQGPDHGGHHLLGHQGHTTYTPRVRRQGGKLRSAILQYEMYCVQNKVYRSYLMFLRTAG